MNDLESSDDGDDQGESGFGGSMPASERRSTGGTLELDRTPAERHAFMFRHNLSAAQPRLEDFRPLPSQVPFLINVFHENVNSFVQVVHIPTVHKMTRDIRKQGGTSSLSPSDEALLFSIYYVAVTSMEDEDVIANFGTTKNDLNLKFRLGFEHAMARADFLNSPNLTLVQALATFLFLVRRYDSPRYVWMMVGVAIRMAQSLGLHRDGASFPGLSPFEIEIRRRVWWALYILDLRSSEDQGTSMTITEGNFDTKRPLSINDNDISPQTTELPPEREGYTDMTMPGIYIDTAAAAAKLLSVEIHDGIPDIEHHGRLVIESYAVLERCGAQISNAQYRMAMVIASLVVAKTTLILYLPVVAAAGSPGTTRTEDISRKLLVSAIEVAEFNHELSADLAFRNWHWLCQTYSHWYAIVYILTRISARPWSPTSERAWTALRSPWLIPKYPEHVKRNNQVIVPLRRLMAKSKAHRASELRRLRSDPVAAQAVEEDDKKNPTARSHGIDVILEGSDDDVQAYHLEKWRQLLMHGGSDAPAQLSSSSSASPRAMSNIAPAYASGGAGMSGTEASYSTMSLGSFDTSPSNTGSGVSNTMAPGTLHQASTSFHPDPVAFVSARNLQQQQASWNSEYRAPTTTDDNSEAPPPASGIGTGAVLESWLWADADLGGTLPPSSGQSYHNGQGGDWADTTMNNFDAEMNWLDLIESAKDMEWEALPQMGGMW
ncbi:C6 transcription factor AsaR [Microdochium nivale]|nr:C6 transcription factor AsaR [Microdochium nivale]